MKNRYGKQYDFVAISENTYKIVGDLDYWRFGGQEYAETIDYNNLGFVDPSGGPFISAGYQIGDKKVKKISLVNEDIVLEVE